ncbi:hypothetical protein BGW38_010471 [Lunasporangiospora selenospora]|uniref:Xaa-Pro dipeptidyl-peptidase-like domain-containing protein n=1 Tax=Lunasporangiospora selenospora TaxID=979761 RepID=A0A9P6G260_9FUNG|nr:hypothetical protein BGW38_010471 [Lunasporangiospora selenospora]
MVKNYVSFKSDNLKLAAHLHVPDTYKNGKKMPAIVTVHPFGGVKEQTAGVYAKALSNHGFITLAFDRRHQGSSEGEPRQLENPEGMSEDVKSAVTFLTLQEQVDPERIGVLGKKALGPILVEAGEDRTNVAKGGEVKYLPIVPALNEITAETPELLREGSEYYLTPRGSNPSSINRTAVMGYDRMATFDSFAFVNWISPRPLLLIAGDKADTLKYSEEAYDKAEAPKELRLIENATHIALYDQRAPDVVARLAEFYKKHL